jgi:hypothetical protein
MSFASSATSSSRIASSPMSTPPRGRFGAGPPGPPSVAWSRAARRPSPLRARCLGLGKRVRWSIPSPLGARRAPGGYQLPRARLPLRCPARFPPQRLPPPGVGPLPRAFQSWPRAVTCPLGSLARPVVRRPSVARLPSVAAGAARRTTVHPYKDGKKGEPCRLGAWRNRGVSEATSRTLLRSHVDRALAPPSRCSPASSPASPQKSGRGAQPPVIPPVQGWEEGPNRDSVWCEVGHFRCEEIASPPCEERANNREVLVIEPPA